MYFYTKNRGLRHGLPFEVPQVGGVDGQVVNGDARLVDVFAVVGEGLGGGGVLDNDDSLHEISSLAFDAYLLYTLNAYLSIYYHAPFC